METGTGTSYEEKPWLKFYPPGVSATVEIPEKSMGEMFDEATDRWGSRKAIVFYGRDISYRELREQVDRFANALYHLGIRKGDRVAILMVNSPQFFITFHGAAKIGAVVTPLSPVYVSREMEYQLKDCGAETIVCLDILWNTVEKTGIKFKNVILTNISEYMPKAKRFLGKSVLRAAYQKMAMPSAEILKGEGFYQFQDLLREYPPSPPKVEINTKEDLLNLPYTAGTTGNPKGVMITQYNTIANAIQWRSFYPFLEDGKDVFVVYMPLYHMAAQAIGLVSGIFSGFTLVLLTTPVPDDILSAINTYKATVFMGAPALAESLKDYEKTDRVNWKKFKVIWCGADALHESTRKGWMARTGTQLSEMYGMTEFSGGSHGNPVGGVKEGSMGIPWPNTQAAVLDPDKDVFLSMGEVGELAVHGPQVTRGYWDKPDVTRECEAIINGVRWWRTGDLVNMDEDGYFYFYDRKQDFIKYKGYKIHPREIEEVLKKHPQIRESGVIGVKDPKVGEDIKVFVVLERDARGKLSEQDIVKYCENELAHYKIPKIVEFVGEIPKTDVGKVSRRELRETEE